MKVFLSSTAQDLDAYRRVADDTILRLSKESVAMERFGPLPNSPAEECERLARESDVVVCIVAHRYGFVPEKGKGSITRREVEAAKAAGKDVLAWIVADDFRWTEEKEQDLLTDPTVLADPVRVAEVARGVGALVDFKNWLRETFVCDTFTTPNDLGRKISIALKTRTSVEQKPDGKLTEIRSDAELRIAYEITAKSRHPCNGATLADLDWLLVDLFSQKELIDNVPSMEREELLAELGLFSPLAKPNMLHNAAVLCFCKRPHRLLPQATSNFIVGQPGDESFILKEVTGPLSRQVEQLVSLAMERLGRISKFNEGGLRTEDAEIPLNVVREAISNAIAHRDYHISGTTQVRLTENYLEIQNPGCFPRDASWETFLSAQLVSRPSDMAVALYLKRLLAVEGIGRGFAVFRNYIQEFGIDSIVWSMPTTATVLVRIKRFVPPTQTAELQIEIPRDIKTLPLAQDKISISRLPTSGPELFGRDAELQLLDEAWANPDTNILTIVSWGGTGKTALVNHWLKQRMAKDNYRGAERVYAWSFYSQGASERAASADLFIDQALRWFGDSDPTAGSPWDKGERLARYIRETRTLLVLDGLEPLQHPPGPHEGRLKDPAVQALISELAMRQPGLCLVTTRERVGDLVEFENGMAVQHGLESLSPQAGAQILRSLNVKGEADELEQATKELRGHAFSLTLLGSYLDEVFQGDIQRLKEIENLFDDTRYGDAAQKMIAAYENWLGEGMELAILRLLGLFDRPAKATSIAALLKAPAIPGLTEPLMDYKPRKWNQAVAKLRRVKLLGEASANEPGTLDAHPLVREHFKQQLKRQRPDAWREANNRLYEHFKDTAKISPDTVEEMSPLYAAVAHACAANRHQEALVRVYIPRIQRGEEYFSTRKLGLFGAGLATLSGFFTMPWEQTVTGLPDLQKTFVLNEVGFDLRALGRLREAAQPMQTALEVASENKDWTNAAINASNLSELYLTSGDLPQALALARQSVKLAKRTGDAIQRLGNLTTFADALHCSGRIAEASKAFRKAEGLQGVFRFEFPLLYSLYGFRYCDLLLDQGEVEQVKNRAARTLEWAEPRKFLLDIALDNLSLGRAWLVEAYQAQTNDTKQAEEFLQRSVDGLRRAGQMIYLPRGLLARAELHRHNSDFERAERDLAEVLRIATRSGMGLHLADYYLESARLQLAQSNKEKALEHLATAKKMIKRMGYHRRDKEVSEIEQQLAEAGQ